MRFWHIDSGDFKGSAAHKRDKRNKRRILYERSPLCAYCGKLLTIKQVTLDHVWPKAKGGGDNIDNLVISCGPCNYTKGNQFWIPRYPPYKHMNNFIQFLVENDACADARTWVRQQRTPEEAWLNCANPQWMIWLITRTDGEAESRRIVEELIKHCISLLESNLQPKAQLAFDRYKQSGVVPISCYDNLPTGTVEGNNAWRVIRACRLLSMSSSTCFAWDQPEMAIRHLSGVTDQLPVMICRLKPHTPFKGEIVDVPSENPATPSTG